MPRSSASKPSRSAKTSSKNGSARATKTSAARPSDGKKRRGRPPRTVSDGAEATFPGERVIHRYANRRFYDLRQSRAVTLEEVAIYVHGGETVRVIDVEAGNVDITRRVLTQIILDSDDRKPLELLPVELLTKIITLRDEALSDWLQQYLSAGAHFLERSAKSAFPAALTLQETVSEMMGRFMPTGDEKGDPHGVAALRQNDVSDMAGELRDLRRRLDEMSKEKSRRG